MRWIITAAHCFCGNVVSIHLIDDGNDDENGNDGDDNESLIYIILMIFNDHDDSHEYDVNQDYDEFAVSM